MFLLLACGQEATPTATPALNVDDIAAQVQTAMEQVMADQPTGDAPSADVIASLVQEAVAASAPSGTTPEQVQALVESAVAAAVEEGGSTDDLQAAMAQAVQSAMSQAMAAATPTAAPAPDAMMPAKVEPYGVLDVGHPELGVMIFVLKNQPYQAFRFTNTMGTHETFFARAPDGSQIPHTVQDWEAEEAADGATYTFRFHEGVKWHDRLGDWGNLTVDDVLFSIENISSEGTPHAAAGGIRRIFGCEESAN